MNIQDYFEWDEYMCTGIDPTGGGLGPDFDPETGRYHDDIEEEEEAATAAAKAAAQRENVLAKVPYSTSPEELHRMRKLSKTGPQYLFFDTETTGLPYYDNISAEAAPDNWPRLVQLSWIITDTEGNITKEMNKFVIPDGFVIPADATKIHGISTEYAEFWGERLERVLHVFNKSLRKVDYIICHNTWFDLNVIYGEMKRLNIPTTIIEKKAYCTMVSGTDLCAIEWEGPGYKWPTLQELHKYLFHKEFSDAHDALADVKAVARCFWEMRDRRYI